MSENLNWEKHQVFFCFAREVSGVFVGFSVGAGLYSRHALQLLPPANPSCRLQHRPRAQ